MDTQGQKLKTLLTGQDFNCRRGHSDKLEEWKEAVKSYTRIENGIAVLSDFKENCSYVCAGKFGKCLGIEYVSIKAPSAFEDDIFSCIPQDELIERHVSELRFFNFLKTVQADERTSYFMATPLHFRIAARDDVSVLHRIRYLEILPNGSVWLSLCLYTPFAGWHDNGRGRIINSATGREVEPDAYERLDARLLSPRETHVLALLSKGMGSKQIAEELCISVNTVYRHRQNILAALQVNNTAAAVEIGLRMRMITHQAK